MKQVLRDILCAVGGGYLLSMANDAVGTKFLSEFFRANLITLLIALLAINCATLGVVLTKIRELADRNNKHSAFLATRRQMELSIREQVALIALSIIALMLEQATFITQAPNWIQVIKVGLCSIFIYSVWVLYDTAKSVFGILDFGAPKE